MRSHGEHAVDGEKMRDQHEAPFFVVGAQRSGTTMLRLMLNQHSELCVPFESVFIPAFYRRLNEYGDLRAQESMERLLDDIIADPWVQKAKLVPDRQAVLAQEPVDYAGLVDAIFGAYAQAQGKSRWGDKTPGYVEDLDLINRLFPECRVIHLVRDGRDVALSLAGVSWGSRDLIKNAADWRWKAVLGRKMGGLMGPRYLEVFYEDLVSNPREVLGEICDFLGAEYEDSMLRYSEAAQGEMPARSLRWHRSSIAPPDRSKVQAWRAHMPLSDQIVFDDVAGDALDLFGYQRVRRQRTWSSRIRYAQYALRGHC